MQMKRYFPLYILLSLFLGGAAFTSCNDSSASDSPLDDSDQFAVMITGFNLKANDSILANLDSVYFSIDLNRGTVFNADSLPLGTRVDSLGVNITLGSVSKAEITMPGKDGADTVVDYLKNSTTAIDFSKGSVTLRLVSVNAQTTRDYRIFVNVHKMKPDSLAWGNAEWSAYPTNIASPTVLKAVELSNRAICFASDGTASTRAISENPALKNWAIQSVTLPQGLDVNSITAGESTLYAIASNKLMQSTDEGLTWTSLDADFTHIYGVYESTVLGVNRDASGAYSYVTYPASQSAAVPADAPVSGTSQYVTFVSEWATDPMLMVHGGLTASGQPSGSTWAYDGEQWAPVSMKPMPELTGVTMVPYFTYRVRANWVATKRATLIAFGGTDATGRLNRNVYLSFDRGVNWALAGSLMQLPEAVPTLTGAQALVFESVLPSRSASSQGHWCSVELPSMPAWLSVDADIKAIAPIESWDCPYIYVFGGQTENRQANTQVWRGVINRLSFKPLQ